MTFIIIYIGNLKTAIKSPVQTNFVEIEYTYEGTNIPIAICVNDSIQQEEWRSGYLMAGNRSIQRIPIAAHDSFASILFQINL